MTSSVLALRKANMKRFGFGPEVMKQTKVCPACGATADADESECFRCGADLPGETLFDLYTAALWYPTPRRFVRSVGHSSNGGSPAFCERRAGSQ